MKRRSIGRWVLCVLGLTIACPLAAWCCNVPVFRYALENWQPSSYQVLVLSRGELDASQQADVERLAAAAVDAEHPANLQVHAIDLQTTSLTDALRDRLSKRPPPDWAIERLEASVGQESLDEPLMVVLYPNTWDRIAWQAPLSAEHVDQLVDSPVRQEIARRLLDGQSAVWVFLESGDAESDEKAWNVLQAELARSSEVVKLPDQELIETDEFYRPDVEIELRVEFTSLRLAADDPAEQAFAALLRGSEADLSDFNEPIAIPIYGRGRTYFALVGAGMNADMIEENGHFLCGACSCQIKEDNPGLDMLMAVNWADQVEGTAMPQVILPELTGIGALEVATHRADRADVRQDSPANVATQTEPTSIGDGVDLPPAQETEPGVLGAAVARDDVRVTGHETSDMNSLVETHQRSFQQRLILGVVGGTVVAVFLLTLATVFLRRG